MTLKKLEPRFWSPMVEPLWSSAEIAAATGGRLYGAAFEAEGISIDTRTLQRQDLFVALSGERDGQAFVSRAFEGGAAGALASQSDLTPAVVVGDTLKALGQLGVAARKRSVHARRCAVTGSVGKTSVTQAIAAAVARSGPSHSSVQSYNNHIGVPLTLARMPRPTRFAVFEIGMNHAEEIRPLTKMVGPHVAVVTTVGGAHIENFADGDLGVARAKAEIFDGLEPEGAAILNADNPWFEFLNEAAKAKGARISSFGRAQGCDARLLDMETRGEGSRVSASWHGRPLNFALAQTGAHWGLNSLAVLLAVDALGASVEGALEALANFAPLPGRGERHRLMVKGAAITLIDESYNANPVSMGAALSALGEASASRKIAVLTDMLELGEGGPGLHVALAEPLQAAGVDLVFLAGPMMQGLFQTLPEKMRGAWRETAEALIPEILSALRSGDVITAKGSKGSKASLVVSALLGAGRHVNPAVTGEKR